MKKREGNKMRPIKYDAIHNDMRLMEMALYETTKGQTHHSSTEKVTQKLAEYKRLIKRGTFTLDELEDKIFGRYGILNDNSEQDTAMYDASKEHLSMACGGIFEGFFRKSQGLPDIKDNRLPDELDDELDELNKFDEFEELEELEELDDQFKQEQIDEDFPEGKESKDVKEDPEDDLPF